jgi:hypothetical protein
MIHRLRPPNLGWNVDDKRGGEGVATISSADCSLPVASLGEPFGSTFPRGCWWPSGTGSLHSGVSHLVCEDEQRMVDERNMAWLNDEATMKGMGGGASGPPKNWSQAAKIG